MAPRSAAVAGCVLLALTACGDDDAAPSTAPADDVDIAVASPCEAVDRAAVEQVLGAAPRAQATLAPGDLYPEGLVGYPVGTPAPRFVCIYQGEAGAEVSLAVGEPDAEAFEDGRTAAATSRCTVDEPSPLGARSYVARCFPPGEPPFVSYVLLTPSSLFQCLGGGAGPSLTAVEPQVERLCGGVVDQLSG